MCQGTFEMEQKLGPGPAREGAPEGKQAFALPRLGAADSRMPVADPEASHPRVLPPQMERIVPAFPCCSLTGDSDEIPSVRTSAIPGGGWVNPSCCPLCLQRNSRSRFQVGLCELLVTSMGCWPTSEARPSSYLAPVLSQGGQAFNVQEARSLALTVVTPPICPFREIKCLDTVPTTAIKGVFFFFSQCISNQPKGKL